MKKQSISRKKSYSIFFREDGHMFKIPKNLFSKIEQYEITSKIQIEKARKNIRWENADNPGILFADLNNKYGKIGALVKGIRYRENLTQAEFAKKINITQSDLSKIENGKRAIGAIVSNRIINKFRLNKNLF